MRKIFFALLLLGCCSLFAQEDSTYVWPVNTFEMAVGSGDFLHRQNTLLHQFMDDHQYKHRFYESDGGHEWKNYKDYLTLFLPKLFRDVDDTGAK